MEAVSCFSHGEDYTSLRKVEGLRSVATTAKPTGLASVLFLSCCVTASAISRE